MPIRASLLNCSFTGTVFLERPRTVPVKLQFSRLARIGMSPKYATLPSRPRESGFPQRRSSCAGLRCHINSGLRSDSIRLGAAHFRLIGAGEALGHIVCKAETPRAGEFSPTTRCKAQS